MRIGSGIFSGQKIKVPDGFDIRPTQTRIRQAIFNMLREKINETTVIDFFAGTGAFGLEALSNGAKQVVFVENKYAKLIYKNAEKLKIEKEKYKILKIDYELSFKFFKKMNIKADIIFLDPPYNKGYIKKFLQLLFNNDILIKGGLLVLEIHKNEYRENCEILKKKNIIKNKKYGDIYIIIIKE